MDWNGDGLLDILSGCYWSEGAQAGYIQLLAGTGVMDFANAKPLTNGSGLPVVNVPPKAVEGLTTDEPANRQDGEDQPGEERPAASNDIEWANICTHPHAVDYDGDGDLDLVIGCIGREFFLVENKGAPGSPMLSDQPQRLGVTSSAQHSAPHLVDWDGDGDLDLLSGTSEGGVIFSKNVGGPQLPKWSSFESLIPSSSRNQQTTDDGQVIVPAPSTRVWVTDWNRDGQLDLLVGDSVTLANRIPGLSEAEAASLREAYESQMADASDEYASIMEKYEAALAEDGEVPQQLEDELQAASSKFSELQELRSKFIDERRTGFVWVYLRSPASTRIAGRTEY